MAICVQQDTNGVLYANGSTEPTCTDYLLLDSAEFQAFQQLQTGQQQMITFQDVFAIPEASQLGEAFALGFSFVMICYLVSWGYGVVINFFNPSHERY